MNTNFHAPLVGSSFMQHKYKILNDMEEPWTHLLPLAKTYPCPEDEEEVDDTGTRAGQDGLIWPYIHPYYHSSTRNDKVHILVETLHQLCDGKLEPGVEILLAFFKNPVMRALLDECYPFNIDIKDTLHRLAQYEGIFAYLRERVKALYELLPRTEASHVYQALATILPPTREGTAMRRLIKQLFGYGDDALNGGAARAELLEKNDWQHGEYWQEHKSKRADALELKCPEAASLCLEYWRDHTQPTPFKNSTKTDHVPPGTKPGHRMARDPSTGQRHKVCPPGCKVEATHYQIHRSADMYRDFLKKYDKINVNEKQEDGSYMVVIKDTKEVISHTFFKAMKPWYVVDPTRRTCGCVWHNKMRFAVEDVHDYLKDRGDHTSCGPSTAPSSPDDCKCHGWCNTGKCKGSWWSSVEGVLSQLCCPPNEPDGTLDWACVSGQCDKCPMGSLKNKKVPPILACPLDAHDPDDGEKEAIIHARQYVKEMQIQIEAEDDDASTTKTKKVQVIRKKPMPWGEFVSYFLDTARDFALHQYINHHQVGCTYLAPPFPSCLSIAD